MAVWKGEIVEGADGVCDTDFGDTNIESKS